MSIANRLEESAFLYAHGYREGALLTLLTAVSATSRLRYPSRKMGDREAFTRFLADEMVVVTRGAVQNFNVCVPGGECEEYPDGLMPLGLCFYRFVRCHLAHEAKIAENVEFVEAEEGSLTVEITDDLILLSDSFLDGLAAAVQYAPENADKFEEVRSLTSEEASKRLFGDRFERHPEYMKRRNEAMNRLWESDSMPAVQIQGSSIRSRTRKT